MIAATGLMHWTIASGSPAFVTTPVNNGARALRCNAAGAAVVAGCVVGIQTVNTDRLYIRFATSLPSGNTFVAYHASGATNSGIYFQSSDSKLYARSGTTNGSTGVTVTTGVWYRIDLRVDQTNTAAVVVDGQVDGTALGQVTNNVGATSAGLLIGVQAAVTADIYFDDVVISATSADYPIGAGYVNHFVPTSDGTHNIAGTGDFQRGNTAVDILNSTTTAFQLIDDVPLPSGTVDEADDQRAVAPANPTTDYVECVFGPAPTISTPTVAPRAVEVILAHHQIATQNGQMQVLLNDNGTTNTVFDTGVAAGVTTYRYARKHYATAPTGGAWTVSAGAGNFNNVRCRFLGPDAAPDQCLDAIMIEAEFAATNGGLTLSVGDDLNAAF